MSIAYMENTNRTITDADREAAKRLRDLWSTFKKTNKLSQEKAAARIDMTQAAFS